VFCTLNFRFYLENQVKIYQNERVGGRLYPAPAIDSPNTQKSGCINALMGIQSLSGNLTLTSSPSISAYMGKFKMLSSLRARPSKVLNFFGCVEEAHKGVPRSSNLRPLRGPSLAYPSIIFRTSGSPAKRLNILIKDPSICPSVSHFLQCIS